MRGPSLPTAGGDWRRMARTARLVLASPGYLAGGVVAAVAGLTLAVAAQNLSLVRDVVVFGSQPLGARLAVLVGLYPVTGAAYRPSTAALLLLTAGLIGINVAMVAYHLRERVGNDADGDAGGATAGSAVGVVLATLGAGCAACGPAVALGLLSLVGVSVSLTVLPLDGLEFLLLAVLMLVLTIHWIAEGMRGGEVRGCPIE